MKDKLYEICKKYIEDHNICCDDCIGQQDDIIIDAYGLIQDICDCIGYCEAEEEE